MIQKAALLSIAMTVAPAISPTLAATFDGALDAGFYQTGQLTIAPGSGGSSAIIWASAEAPDGTVVVAGFREASGGSHLFWTALDGLTPPTLCQPGVAALGGNPAATAATFDAQGRLVLAGTTLVSGNVQGFVARFLYPSCALDPSFDGDGVWVGTSATSVRFTAIDLDSQQRIVLAGDDLGASVAIAVRLLPSGEPDPSFAGGGSVEIILSSPSVSGLAVQKDDRVVLGGSLFHPGQGLNFFALRLTVAGAVDTTFSGDGVVEVDFAGSNDTAGSLALDPIDGHIVLGGQALGPASLMAVVRLTASGDFDLSFGEGGRWTHAFPSRTGYLVNAMTLQTDGRIILGGQASEGDADFWVFRLTHAGELDTSFGTRGAIAVPFDLGGRLDDGAYTMRLQGGQLFLAGGADVDAHHSVAAAARLWVDAVPPTDIEARATATLSASRRQP